MKERYKEIQGKFETQVTNVYKISEFDSDFLSLAIDWLKELENDLKENLQIENENYLPTKTIKLLHGCSGF